LLGSLASNPQVEQEQVLQEFQIFRDGLDISLRIMGSTGIIVSFEQTSHQVETGNSIRSPLSPLPYPDTTHTPTTGNLTVSRDLQNRTTPSNPVNQSLNLNLNATDMLRRPNNVSLLGENLANVVCMDSNNSRHSPPTSNFHHRDVIMHLTFQSPLSSNYRNLNTNEITPQISNITALSERLKSTLTFPQEILSDQSLVSSNLINATSSESNSGSFTLSFQEKLEETKEFSNGFEIHRKLVFSQSFRVSSLNSSHSSQKKIHHTK